MKNVSVFCRPVIRSLLQKHTKMSKNLDWKGITPAADLVFSPEPSYNQHNNKSIPVQVKTDTGPQGLRFQMPPVVLKFGIEKKDMPTAAYPEGKKYYAPLSFPSVKKDHNGNYICDPGYENQLKFVKFIEQVDETNITVALMNSEPWFSKKKSKETLLDSYNPSLRSPKKPGDDQKWSPTFSTKLIYSNAREDFVTRFYDKKQNRIKITDFEPYCTVIPVIKATGIWFGKCMCFWG